MSFRETIIENCLLNLPFSPWTKTQTCEQYPWHQWTTNYEFSVQWEGPKQYILLAESMNTEHFTMNNKHRNGSYGLQQLNMKLVTLVNVNWDICQGTSNNVSWLLFCFVTQFNSPHVFANPFLGMTLVRFCINKQINAHKF